MKQQRYIYLLERIRDGVDWKMGDRIWAYTPCAGWRVLDRVRIDY